VPIIAPFNGIRYNRKQGGSISRVVTPPYDVISPRQQAGYYRKHPNSFIRLVLGKTYASDTAARNRYSRAKAVFDRWMKSGVLKQDAEPSVYPYSQAYLLNGKRYIRWGVISLVHLASKDIYPHENIRKAPKMDRQKLLGAVRAALSPIFGLVPDRAGGFRAWIRSACAVRRPEAVALCDGVEHRLWRISDPKRIAQLQRLMDRRALIIADGHHRFEAACQYRRQRGRHRKGSTAVASDYTMFYLAAVAKEDPGLLPTHRVVQEITPRQLERLAHGLSGCNGPIRRKLSAQEMQARLKRLVHQRKVGMGVYLRSRKPFLLEAAGNCQHGLDVEWLHKGLLPRWVGPQAEVVYTQDLREGLRWLKAGKAQVVFQMQPPRFDEVLARARSGKRMPGKTTYFYPKPIAGLVEYRFD